LLPIGWKILLTVRVRRQQGKLTHETPNTLCKACLQQANQLLSWINYTPFVKSTYRDRLNKPLTLKSQLVFALTENQKPNPCRETVPLRRKSRNPPNTGDFLHTRCAILQEIEKTSII
jgi:hypothetical protein